MIRPYSGEKCKRGHQSPRYTANNGCVECASIASKRQYASIKEDPEQYAIHKERCKTHPVQQGRCGSKLKPYSGKPCRRMHHAPRYVSNNACVECVKIASRKHRERRKPMNATRCG